MEKSKSGSAVRSGPGRQMLRRCVVLAAVFGVGVFAVLLARLYQLQIKEHEFYEELAIEQQLRSTPGSASRGAIYDANMNALAVSATVDNVYLSPAEIEAYGEDRALIARPALHSYILHLRQPLSGADITVTAPIPGDMTRLMQKEAL